MSLSRAFDEPAPRPFVPERSTMMFVLDFPLVSLGKCGQPVYLTPAPNLYSRLLSRLLSFAPLPQFELITSGGSPCTTELQAARRA